MLVVMFALLLAACADGQNAGCGHSMALPAGCAEGANPIPYGD
jgi:hypothetical protein